MATGNAKRFTEMGVAPRLAREYAAQITGGVGNQRRLIELGEIPSAAKLLASLFSGGAVSNNRLTEAGVVPRVVREAKTQVGSSGGSTPASAWRVPLAAVTDSQGDATTQATLLASPAAKSFPSYTIAGNATRTMTWAYSAPVQAPGGLFYYANALEGPATGLFEYTTDGTTWTAIPYTPGHASDDGKPAGYLDYNNGQLVQIPTGATGFRAAITPGAQGATIHTKMLQRQATAAANDIWGYFGNSLIQQTHTPATVVGEMGVIDPTRDPVVILYARGAASGASIVTIQAPQMLAAYPFIQRYIADGTTSDFVFNGSPRATDPHPTLSRDNLVDLYNFLTTRGKTAYMLTAPYGDYKEGRSGASSSPNGVNGLLNQDRGSLPYNQLGTYPALLAAGALVDTTLGDSFGPNYLPTMDSYEQVLEPDGVHQSVYGGPFFTRGKQQAWVHGWTGSAGKTWLDLVIDGEGGRSVTPARKARLQAMYDALQPNPTSAQASARATLQSKISALSTTFVDAPGYTAPIAATSIAAVFDFDNLDRMTLTNPQSAEYLVGQVTDRTAAGHTLSQATVLQKPVSTFFAKTMAQSRQRWLSFRQSNLGPAIGGGNVTQQPVMTGSAAFMALLNAANQPFTIYWIERAVVANTATANLFAWEAGTVPVLRVARVGGTVRTRLLISTTGANTVAACAETDLRDPDGAPVIMSLVYDGTTLSLQRGTGTPVTASWNKPAMTADAFNIGTSAGLASLTDFNALHVYTVAHTPSQRAAAIANLQARVA